MRTLLVLRGAPGSGKSTWIKQNKLEKYTICPDDIRVLCSSRELFADGRISTPCNRNTETQTWKIVMDLLEYRMSRGEFTVIDATASKTSEILRYTALSDTYRYRVYCIDFTDVPLDVCIAQNAQRESDKVVPEDAIRRIYARFETQAVPSGVVTLKRDEWQQVLQQPVCLDEYKRLVVIGDIHGCYDTLMQYEDFKNGLRDDTSYIFVGDYLDRGNQNAETLKFLMSIMNKKNVCLLEGNHDQYLRNFGLGIQNKAHEFEEHTKPQLLAAGLTDKDARMFTRKLRQMSYISYRGKEILVCHGGVAGTMDNLAFMPTYALVNGTGEFKEHEAVAETWVTTMKPNQYMIHGHRNVYGVPLACNDRVFNLEGKVEFGGQLRIVELDGDSGIWTSVYLDSIQPVIEGENTEEHVVETVDDAITYLRNNEFVQEKQLGNGISSFNFTREAFFKGNWNRQTVLARGLFIDTVNKSILARSYEKFFKINEMPYTTLPALKSNMEFPVRAYVKENGFLAIVSYNPATDDLFVASKSTNQGDYVGYIQEALEPIRESVLSWLRGATAIFGPMSLVFECIDTERDPHIIKYSHNRLVLLDAIYNTLDYKAVAYDVLVKIAADIDCEVKELAFELRNWDDFMDLYLQVTEYDYQYNGDFIEGFVFQDNKGFMTKCKSGYYNFWKHMRGVADQTLRCGNYFKTGSLQDVLSNKFFGFCKRCYWQDKDKETKTYPYKTDIISLREKFLIENN